MLLKQTCVYSLLHTENALELLKFISVGMYNLTLDVFDIHVIYINKKKMPRMLLCIENNRNKVNT